MIFKKYFLYELKTNRRLIGIISVIFTIWLSLDQVSYLLDRSSFRFESVSSGVISAFSWLSILACVVPIYIFNFKMKSQLSDLFYSMPISRVKLYLVRSLVGLIIVFVPFSIAYWFNFIIMVFSPVELALIYYIPLYLIAIPFATLLFGFCSFAFTRAYRMSDGALYIALYSIVSFVIVAFILAKLSIIFKDLDIFLNTLYFFPQFALSSIARYFDALILNQNDSFSVLGLFNEYFSGNAWISYVFLLVAGSTGWAGLFLMLPCEKPENSQHISESLLGFRMLIPAILIPTIGMLATLAKTSSVLTLLVVPLIFSSTVTAFVGYVVFRHTIFIKRNDLLVMLISIASGIILGLI